VRRSIHFLSGIIATFCIPLVSICDCNGTALDIRWFNCSDATPDSRADFAALPVSRATHPIGPPASDLAREADAQTNKDLPTHFVKLAMITSTSNPPPLSVSSLFTVARDSLQSVRFSPFSRAASHAASSDSASGSSLSLPAPLFTSPIELHFVDGRYDFFIAHPYAS
jgi:hypothetical protein